MARLKGEPGKDIIVYGGSRTVADLIAGRLIDEFYLFVNPAAIGRGLSIFDKVALVLVESRAFDCGIVLLHYRLP